MAQIGEKIRLARDLKGMSQAELAEAVGVDVPSVSRWETGKTRPRGKLPRIAEALDKPVGWFFSEEIGGHLAELEKRLVTLENATKGLSADLTPKEIKLLQLFRSVTNDFAGTLLGVVEDAVRAHKDEKGRRSGNGR